MFKFIFEIDMLELVNYCNCSCVIFIKICSFDEFAK